MRPWLRRLRNRVIPNVPAGALIGVKRENQTPDQHIAHPLVQSKNLPAVAVIGIYGENRTTDLLVASQVVLSMQLGFAVWPLLRFTGDRAKMGSFVNPPLIKALGWTTACIIITLNLKLLFDTFAPESVQHGFYRAIGLPV
jgi:Mn2+/Fe2+ NRAMP family transporter